MGITFQYQNRCLPKAKGVVGEKSREDRVARYEKAGGLIK